MNVSNDTGRIVANFALFVNGFNFALRLVERCFRLPETKKNAIRKKWRIKHTRYLKEKMRIESEL